MRNNTSDKFCKLEHEMEINKKEMKTNPQGLGQDPETEEEPQGT